MFSLFRPRLPIDSEELEFQLATFKWLVRTFGPVAETPLVLPTPDFFPSDGRAGVETLFDEVRRAADMEDWPCTLEAGDSDRSIDGGNDHLIQHIGATAPCGTFRVVESGDGHEAIITYNPDMEHDTIGMVATFAHELAHYLLANAEDSPPGGWDLNELHTDLTAVYLGFGIFLANGARSFTHIAQGRTSAWSAKMQGYLSEGALVTALAIFQRLGGREPLAAEPYLKPYLVSDLKRADRALKRLHPDLPGAVQAIDLSQFVSES